MQRPTQRAQWRNILSGWTVLPAFLSGVLSLALAQTSQAQSVSLPSTSSISRADTPLIAITAGDQPRLNPTQIPTDITPLSVDQSNVLAPGYKFRLFQRLPERLSFTSTTEVSQRLETNVFFTRNNPRPDYVFRVLPNVTLGWNLLPNTSIYGNWFLIKDLFADHAATLNFPTTQSLALGLRQDIPLGRKTNIQLDFQARELWQTAGLHQADLIPAINFTHVLRPSIVLFGSLLLQMRGHEYFVAPTRELDPFYTLGAFYRRNLWTFLFTDTLVTNFRSPPFNGSVPQTGNVSMIWDMEIARSITAVPGLQMFLRAEPIYNWSSHGVPGLSGFDFRLFSGLRMTVNKPSYAKSIKQLRDQILESEGEGPPSTSYVPIRIYSGQGTGLQAGDVAYTPEALPVLLKPMEPPRVTVRNSGARQLNPVTRGGVNMFISQPPHPAKQLLNNPGQLEGELQNPAVPPPAVTGSLVDS